MLNKKHFYSFFILLMLGFFVLSINVSFAADTIMNKIEDPSSGEFDCKDTGSKNYNAEYCGDYELDDFINIFVKVAQWILGIVGSLALLFFIYGGVLFLISGGSSEKVSKAKEIIVGAVLGIVIVLTSYMIISFVLKALGYTGEWYKGEWL